MLTVLHNLVHSELRSLSHSSVTQKIRLFTYALALIGVYGTLIITLASTSEMIAEKKLFQDEDPGIVAGQKHVRHIRMDVVNK